MGQSKLGYLDFAAVVIYFTAVLGAGLYVSFNTPVFFLSTKISLKRYLMDSSFISTNQHDTFILPLIVLMMNWSNSFYNCKNVYFVKDHVDY